MRGKEEGSLILYSGEGWKKESEAPGRKRQEVYGNKQVKKRMLIKHNEEKKKQYAWRLLVPPWSTKKQLMQKVIYQQFPSVRQKNKPKLTNTKAKFRLVKVLPTVREKEPTAVR